MSKAYKENIEEHQYTPEEIMYFHLLKEKQKTLSESAWTLLAVADKYSYLWNLTHYWSAYEPEEQEKDREHMVSLAKCISHQDHKILTEIVYAASFAGLSIDPEGKALVGYKVDEGDLFRYYKQFCLVLNRIL